MTDPNNFAGESTRNIVEPLIIGSSFGEKVDFVSQVNAIALGLPTDVHQAAFATISQTPAQKRYAELSDKNTARYEAVGAANSKSGEIINSSPIEQLTVMIRNHSTLDEIGIWTDEQLDENHADSRNTAIALLSDASMTVLEELEALTGRNQVDAPSADQYEPYIAGMLSDRSLLRTRTKETLAEFTSMLTDAQISSADLIRKASVLQTYLMLSGQQSLYSESYNRINELSRKLVKQGYAGPIESTNALLRYSSNPADPLTVAAAIIESRKGTNAPEKVAKILAATMQADAAKRQRISAAELRDIATSEMVAVGGVRMSYANIDDLVTQNKQLLDYLGITYVETRETSKDASELKLDTTELNWEVLPEGTLADTAKIIVEDIRRSGKKAEIDLSRLRILQEVRELWGKDRAFYARGQKRSKNQVPASEEEPGDYIILVLQELAADGSIIYEHAVAESPVTQKNALYIYRQDAGKNQTGWRTAMSVPKDEARMLGARPVKHIEIPGIEPIKLMRDKLEHLLTCPADKFAEISFSGVTDDGEVKLTTRRKSIGIFATRRAAANQ